MKVAEEENGEVSMIYRRTFLFGRGHMLIDDVFYIYGRAIGTT